MAEQEQNQTALQVAIAGVTAIITLILSNLPRILGVAQRGRIAEQKSRLEEKDQLAGHYDRLFDKMTDRIDRLEEQHDKCLTEHAETRGEIRALQLRLDLLDGHRTNGSDNGSKPPHSG